MERKQTKGRAKPAHKPKRRVRSPHPGVVLIPPESSGRHLYWRARFIDPDTGRMTKAKLDPLALTTADARRVWAIQKAKTLAKRRMEIESGAPRATGTELSVAIESYFKAHPHLRDKTRTAYRGAADKLLAWAKRSGVPSADDLNRIKLMELRTALVRERKRTAAKQGKRGATKVSAKARSPHTINRELRSLRTVLGYLRDLDLFPKLSHDDLRRALKRMAADAERIEYLKPAECAKLIEAALRHDADVFAETREEHAGLREKGTTRRYEPIAAFVAFVLLTGCRLGEAVALEWSEVDLDALDHEGRKVGEIHLRAAATKTHKARTIGLEVSPALHALLAAMCLESGGKGSVFGLTQTEADAALKRLKKEYGAPRNAGWQMLRRTCGTYLTNASGIFGAASAYRSAKQLGHSVQVAEKHYVDVARGIPRDARTLEAAMQIEEVMSKLAGERSAESNVVDLQTGARV